MKKSLFFTYLLWLFCGWFGLHHFYLRRDRQAFIWWSTLGGCFFLGWFRDLWRIPEYVDNANEDTEFLYRLNEKMRLRKQPQFSIVRFAGQLMVGYFYGLLVRVAIPEETNELIIAIAVSLGVTVGVHIVGNIGNETGGFGKPYIFCLFTYVLLRFLAEEEPGYMYCAVVTACAFNWFRQFRHVFKEKKSFCQRIMILGVACLIICGLWCSFLYFNCEITTESGEKVKFRDSVNHFFKSPAWLEFKDTMYQLYEEARKQGWSNMYNEFVKALDPKGESNARKVLGVTEKTTEKEIKQIYKKLVRQWHPDRYKGDNKRDAEQKFMEIQEAYDILMSKKSSYTRRENSRTEF